MTRVKICGLMNEEDVALCARAGADMLGFVAEYPEPVPWNLTSVEAAELVRKVPPPVETCLVTGGSLGKILELARSIKPQLVQLHHREKLSETAEITKRLSRLGIKTIKALRFDERGFCDFEIRDPALAAALLAEAGVAAILVDAYTAARPGGSGTMVDLATFLAVRQASAVPVVLAGGLNPANIGEIIRKVKPAAIDVLTGVEERPGKKDPLKVTGFMRGARVFSR